MPSSFRSAEVFQEILHRYGALDRLEAIQPAFDVLLAVVDEVLPVVLAAIQIAKRIMMGRLGLSSRDALHVAVMEQAGISRITSSTPDSMSIRAWNDSAEFCLGYFSSRVDRRLLPTTRPSMPMTAR